MTSLKSNDVPVVVLRELADKREVSSNPREIKAIDKFFKEFGVNLDNNEEKNAFLISLSKHESEKPNADLIMINKKLVVSHVVSSKSKTVEDYISGKEKHHKGSSFSSAVEEGEGEEYTDEEHDKPNPGHAVLNTGKVLSTEEVENLVKQQSYTVSAEEIKEHLTRFLYGIKWEDDAYRTGDIKINIYSDKKDVNNLIAAGTKVLDALLYEAIGTREENAGLFTTRIVTKLTASSVSDNIINAKRALLAAVVLVFIQGSLPSKSDDTKPIPKFIKEKIFKGEIGSLKAIAELLSSTNTEKFPSKIFLEIDLDRTPIAISTRCKMSIAGNRAIRYSIFTASLKEAEERAIPAGAGIELYKQYEEHNRRITKAKEIVKALRTIATDYKTQLNMHPLSQSRAVIQNFTLKLTRAIIESVAPSARPEINRKAKKDNNSSFLRDTNFVGSEEEGALIWHILENPDADFNELSSQSVYSAYSKH
uniref:Coat protein n=1 Tax=Thymus ophiovirus TaxID=2983959 RepID=A0A9N7AAR3_9VIRU|nr:TPA_asm: coat protein [Thymus ophiovirus]